VTLTAHSSSSANSLRVASLKKAQTYAASARSVMISGLSRVSAGAAEASLRGRSHPREFTYLLPSLCHGER
jgi:hypothetical protein